MKQTVGLLLTLSYQTFYKIDVAAASFLGFPAYLVISQSARERKEKLSETIKFMFKTCLFHGLQPELRQLGHAVPVGMEGIQRMIPSSQRGQVHQMIACFSDRLADDGIVRLGPADC